MQLRPADVEGISAGRIGVLFRWWDRPRAVAGGRQRWGDVVFAIDQVEVVALDDLTEDDARAAGAADLAALRAEVERWQRPDRALHRVSIRLAGADPRIERRRAGGPDLEARVEAAVARLAAIDRRSTRGAWTLRTLDLIAAHPERRAPDLAELDGQETIVFKRDVRKLKELGLTESLAVGYRLAPFGELVLDRCRTAFRAAAGDP